MAIFRMGTTATAMRFVSDLRDVNSRLADTQRQLSTGKRINTPSDDPVDVSLLMALNRDVAARDRWSKNADDALSWVEATEDALNGAADVVQRARVLALQASNGTLNSGERDVIVAEVQGLLDGIVEIGNTTLAGRYLFGGARTDQAPLDTAGAQTNGNVSPLLREVAQGETVRINVTIDEFTDPDGPGGTPDIVATLQGLITDLQNDDLGAISDRVLQLDAHLENYNALRGRGAGVVNRLEFLQDRFGVQQIALAKQASGIENVDVADTITQLKYEESTLRAALAVGAQIIPVSLVDFVS